VTQLNVETAASLLCENRLSRRLTGPLPPDARPENTAEAYDVQDMLHAALSGRGYGTLCGYKIGCTTRIMQDYLGIDQPCAGGLFAPKLAIDSMEFTLTDHFRLGVECEIAVRVGRDLQPEDAPHDRTAVTAAIAAWMPALEIVEDRFEDYESLGAPTLIADDFFNLACVTGPESRPETVSDIGAVEGRLLIDGAEAGRGNGGDILGDPVEALLWLANHLGARGQPLTSGAIVTLGSVVKTVWVDRPASAQAVFPDLGKVTAVFV